RPASETNRLSLASQGVKFFHADIRSASDFESLPSVDWVIDAAANPSVLAGIDGKTSSRQLVEHNLTGTINMLEYCKRSRAGFVLLSTSRVYSIEALAALPVTAKEGAFTLAKGETLPRGASERGVSEEFSTTPPLSLYGTSKIASETVALEYGATFGFPVWINRCGVLAGAGQFGRPDQGIFAFWINSYLRRAPLSYIGFEGTGFQTRDCLHPRDLVPLIAAQMDEKGSKRPGTMNVGGGSDHAISLAQLSNWCAERFGERKVAADPRPRRFDIPWLVMDSALAMTEWDWKPQTSLDSILDEIAVHAEANPHWLQISALL
ncbi:MAG TPA: NAD-dependent epimerase/dehydratase family protein, partial [Chthoniobacterales bacterium]